MSPWRTDTRSRAELTSAGEPGKQDRVPAGDPADLEALTDVCVTAEEKP